jgi:hypothetical protein
LAEYSQEEEGKVSTLAETNRRVMRPNNEIQKLIDQAVQAQLMQFFQDDKTPA